MKKYLRTACLTVLLASPAVSQISTQVLPLISEVQNLEKDMLVYLKQVGAEIVWENRIESSGATRFQNASIARYGRRFEIEDLRLNGALITARGVTVVHDGERGANERGGDGMLFADVIELSSPKAFMDIFDYVNAVPAPRQLEALVIDIESVPPLHFGDVCGGLTTDGQISYHWDARGVRLSGDLDALPISMPRSEEIHINNIRQQHDYIRSGDACDERSNTYILGVEILAIDNAKILIAKGTIGVSAEWQISDEIFSDETLLDETWVEEAYVQQNLMKFDQLSLQDSEGLVSASLESLTVAYSSDVHMDVLICDIISPEAIRSDLLSRALKTRSGGHVSFSGLDISVPDFLPDYMIDAMGLGTTDRLSGDLFLQGSLVDGKVVSQGSAQIPGITTAAVEFQFQLPSTLEVTLPGFIADRLPLPGELLDMKIEKLAVSYQDDGIGAIISALSGQSPAEMINDRLELVHARVASKLPPFISEKLTGARETVVSLLKSGGSITIEPPEPETVMALAMHSMMNPSLIIERLGIVIDIQN